MNPRADAPRDPLRRRLSAFVRWALRSEITALEEPFAWSVELADLSGYFTGYYWARAVGPGPARVIGVCELQYRPPYELRNPIPLYGPVLRCKRRSSFSGVKDCDPYIRP